METSKRACARERAVSMRNPFTDILHNARFSLRIDHARRTRKNPGIREPTKMDLNDFLGPKPIIIDLRAENRWQAIDELIDQLVVHHKIKAEHRDAIAESVRKRET